MIDRNTVSPKPPYAGELDEVGDGMGWDGMGWVGLDEVRCVCL